MLFFFWLNLSHNPAFVLYFIYSSKGKVEVKVKVNLKVKVKLEQATKAQRGSRGIAVLSP